MQDHHRRGVDLRHISYEMTDRHLRGHSHGLLDGHANRDVGERIHFFLVRDPVMNSRLSSASRVTFTRRSTSRALRLGRYPATARWWPRLHSDAGQPAPAVYESASWTGKSLHSGRP